MGRMPKKKYHIRLSEEERAELAAIVGKGKSGAQRQCHARILLLADTEGPEGGWSDSQIAQAVHTSIPTIERVRRVCVEYGLARALERKDPERHYERKLDGRGEAQLLALSCGEPPAGFARWTLRLLAERLVELEVVAEISHETVRRTLKKTKSSRGGKSSG
jgi:transposase